MAARCYTSRIVHFFLVQRCDFVKPRATFLNSFDIIVAVNKTCVAIIKIGGRFRSNKMAVGVSGRGACQSHDKVAHLGEINSPNRFFLAKFTTFRPMICQCEAGRV